MDNTGYELHPLVTAWLDLTAEVVAAKDHYRYLLEQASATGTDETGTVKIMLDWLGAVHDVWIKPGLMRLGAGVISERLNEALADANATHRATWGLLDEDHAMVLAGLKEHETTLATGVVSSGIVAQERW